MTSVDGDFLRIALLNNPLQGFPNVFLWFLYPLVNAAHGGRATANHHFANYPLLALVENHDPSSSHINHVPRIKRFQNWIHAIFSGSYDPKVETSLFHSPRKNYIQSFLENGGTYLRLSS
jgi:hypothetical protein